MTTHTPISGAFTALVTPFNEQGIDEEAYRKLIDQQFTDGIDGIVAVGTTGESPTLSYQEHFDAIRLAVETAAGRGPVMAGTGSNSTAEAVETTVEAARLGATHALLVAPYYNKPSQEGLFQHFSAIAQATSIPLVLYSIPGRCGIEIGVETVARLADAHPNVVAIKEAGGRVDRVHQLSAALPASFSILSGDDALTLPFMASGARGVISVASNIYPAQVTAMVHALLNEDFAEGRRKHYQLYPLFNGLLSLDVNPVPVKAAMEKMGLIPSGKVRLPLTPLSDEASRTLGEILAGCQL